MSSVGTDGQSDRQCSRWGEERTTAHPGTELWLTRQEILNELLNGLLCTKFRLIISHAVTASFAAMILHHVKHSSAAPSEGSTLQHVPRLSVTLDLVSKCGIVGVNRGKNHCTAGSLHSCDCMLAEWYMAANGESSLMGGPLSSFLVRYWKIYHLNPERDRMRAVFCRKTHKNVKESFQKMKRWGREIER